ncbi:MAG TPA: hypothetical protein VGF67_10145 [Ktedonobacteraceae bacterium]
MSLALLIGLAQAGWPGGYIRRLPCIFRLLPLRVLWAVGAWM